MVQFTASYTFDPCFHTERNRFRVQFEGKVPSVLVIQLNYQMILANYVHLTNDSMFTAHCVYSYNYAIVGQLPLMMRLFVSCK